MKKILLLVCYLHLTGCGGTIEVSPDYLITSKSPDGSSEIFIYEFDDNQNDSRTDVMLYQKNRSGGSGAVSFEGTGLDLIANWVDDENVEIFYPKGTTYQRNVSGEYLQYLDSKVRVILTPTNKEAKRTDY